MDRKRVLAALDVAQRFVAAEAGFAQVTTLNREGFPTARTASAFLCPDWTVELVQRSVHRRLEQTRRDPRALVVWSGSPAPGSRNDSPAVFDLGLLIPRAVFVQGLASEMDEEETWTTYAAHDTRLRAQGRTRAPERDRANVAAELTGLRVRPVRVRLEGFGDGAEAFTWSPEGQRRTALRSTNRREEGDQPC